MKTTRVEKHRIKYTHPFYPIIDNLCLKSKNMYNYGNYIIRQEFIQTSKEKEQGLRKSANWIRYNQLFSMVKDSDPYKDLGNNVGQATLRKLDKNWKSFFESIKDYSKHPDKYLGRPKMPGYLPKETGRYECGLDNNKFKIIDGYVYFCWKPLKVMNYTFKTKITQDTKLFQIRFVPKKREYVMEVVYQADVPDIEKQSERVASVVFGVNNLITVTTNCGIAPFAVNGKPVKSMNQYYHKKISNMRSELKKKHNADWSKEMQRFTDKRNRKVDDYIHKATRIVIDFCKTNHIDTLVCGYNPGQKQNIDMGKKDNQIFCSIPHETIIRRLSYKCEDEGIMFITTDENDVSDTSFLDKEGTVSDNDKNSKCIHRGLYISSNGTKINADVNRSYQIMKKAFPDTFKNGIEGAGLHPTIVNIPLQI